MKIQLATAATANVLAVDLAVAADRRVAASASVYAGGSRLGADQATTVASMMAGKPAEAANWFAAAIPAARHRRARVASVIEDRHREKSR
jgi:hypothetical protein